MQRRLQKLNQDATFEAIRCLALEMTHKTLNNGRHAAITITYTFVVVAVCPSLPE